MIADAPRTQKNPRLAGFFASGVWAYCPAVRNLASSFSDRLGGP